ncbi:MAG: hypothetical protein H8E44_12345 [Planctomycetes bacterium]|nr:hypothetical protein [Planctomycetota bacterium]MBL7039809.1 hypothetical protein [Pirellulaceae bacterium]
MPTPSSGGETNTPGLIGFILSLCGLLCGVMFPIGFVVSLIGLRQQPKGFAIAGTIIGAVGTLLILMVLLIYGAMIATCIGFGAAAAKPVIDTQTAISEAETKIDEYQMENGELPDEETGNQLIADITDGWDRTLRYEPTGDGDYVIRSAGMDGTFDTLDDSTSADDYEWDEGDFEIEIDETDYEEPSIDLSPIEAGDESTEAGDSSSP